MREIPVGFGRPASRGHRHAASRVERRSRAAAVGPLQVRWYGLLFAAGILAAYRAGIASSNGPGAHVRRPAACGLTWSRHGHRRAARALLAVRAVRRERPCLPRRSPSRRLASSASPGPFEAPRDQLHTQQACSSKQQTVPAKLERSDLQEHGIDVPRDAHVGVPAERHEPDGSLPHEVEPPLAVALDPPWSKSVLTRTVDSARVQH